MNPTFAFLFLLTSHFVADFVCQNDWMAHGKSKHLLPLVTHVAVYSLVMAPALGYIIVQMLPPTPPYSTNLIVFGSIGFSFTFIGLPHFLVDFCTSRLNSWLLPKTDLGAPDVTRSWHWFFVGIGFDQMLHAWCLGWIIYWFQGGRL